MAVVGGKGTAEGWGVNGCGWGKSKWRVEIGILGNVGMQGRFMTLICPFFTTFVQIKEIKSISNNMEFEGTVFKILPVLKGTSARGEWQRQDVVFDVPEGTFSHKICVTFFNKPDDVARLKVGAEYKVSVNVESREYKERWYTDIRAWRLQEKVSEPAVPPMPEMPPFGSEEPAYASTPETDDLPF